MIKTRALNKGTETGDISFCRKKGCPNIKNEKREWCEKEINEFFGIWIAKYLKNKNNFVSIVVLFLK